MGQNVHAVLLGVKAGQLSDKWRYAGGGDGYGWDNFVRDAKVAVTNIGHAGPMPVFNWEEDRGESDALFGIWIAVGYRGDHGALPLETPIRLDKMVEDERYKSAIMAAERSFAIAREWALAQGVDLGEPTLWLTTTSVR